MALLTKRDPDFSLGAFRREMERLFDEFTGERWPALFESWAPSPPVEVGETAEEVFVNVQVPGMTKDNLEIQLTEGALTIKGKVEEEKEEKKKSYYRKEFRYGAFSRTVAVPTEVEVDKATADLDKGLLKIRIPKTEKARKRAVTVTIG